MIQLQTFGAAELRRDGDEVRSVLSQPKRLALFIHLLLGSPSGYMNRDAVLARFWPESDSERARNSLRQALHYLRRSLGDQVVESRGDEIGCPPGSVVCDALEFERALSEGRLDDAIHHYRGEFLPAFHVDDAPEVEEWIESQRGYYRRQAFRVAGALAERDAAAGELKAAVLRARQAVAIEPCDEAAIRRLMRLLAATGEAAAALTEFDEFEARLRAAYEIEPGTETMSLAADIRLAAATPPRPSKPRPEVPVEVAPVKDEPPAAADRIAPADAPARKKDTAVAAAPRPPRRPLRIDRWHMAATVAVLLLGAAGWQSLAPRAAEIAPAVAVLPFSNMSGDAGNDYLADALPEELLNVLTRVPGLKVAARTSSFRFRSQDVPLDSLAEALGVTHVVQGSVRGSGERLRIAVQLIESASGYQVWSETFDSNGGDMLQLQSEIARAIAKSLQVRLSPAVARPPGSETTDAEAYRLLLRGNQVMRSGSTREVLAEAGALLQEALRRDPEYARAMAALAGVVSWQATYGYIHADSGHARARALAARSIELAPTVEAHLVLAREAELQQWDTAAADMHYRQALDMNPLDPRTLQFRAIFLARTGRVDEGIAAARTAVELDPLHPGAHNNLAVVLLEADRMEDALDAYSDALLVSPEDAVILGNMANLMARQERWVEALQYLDRALARTPDDVQTLALRASILLRSGERDAGMAMLRELEARPDFPRMRLAILYSNVGDVERILDMLEQAVERREDGMLGLRSPDMFKGMRHHPRFVKLLEAIGA